MCILAGSFDKTILSELCPLVILFSVLNVNLAIHYEYVAFSNNGGAEC